MYMYMYVHIYVARGPGREDLFLGGGERSRHVLRALMVLGDVLLLPLQMLRCVAVLLQQVLLERIDFGEELVFAPLARLRLPLVAVLPHLLVLHQLLEPPLEVGFQVTCLSLELRVAVQRRLEVGRDRRVCFGGLRQLALPGRGLLLQLVELTCERLHLQQRRLVRHRVLLLLWLSLEFRRLLRMSRSAAGRR